MSSRFSNNCEADASKLQENLEEMFPRYYMDSVVYEKVIQPHTDVLPVAIGWFYSPVHLWCFLFWSVVSPSSGIILLNVLWKWSEKRFDTGNTVSCTLQILMKKHFFKISRQSWRHVFTILKSLNMHKWLYGICHDIYPPPTC